MMLVQHSPEHHLKELAAKESNSSEYSTIQSLSGNNCYRWEEDRKKRAFMVGCLFRILKCSSQYFEGVTEDEEAALATLFLGNLQILQFNAHEIYETVRCGKSLIPNKCQGVGLGIYARASYFNHSCHGGVVRYSIHQIEKNWQEIFF